MFDGTGTRLIAVYLQPHVLAKFEKIESLCVHHYSLHLQLMFNRETSVKPNRNIRFNDAIPILGLAQQ